MAPLCIQKSIMKRRSRWDVTPEDLEKEKQPSGVPTKPCVWIVSVLNVVITFYINK